MGASVTDWLPAPDVEICREMLAVSSKLLKKTWISPTKVGLSSELLLECETHWERIRQHCTPPSDVEADATREVFLTAMRKAWFAVWMARDYSIDGWKRRLAERDPRLTSRVRSFVNVIPLAGREWFATHVPLFDDEGDFRSQGRPSFPEQFVSPGWAELFEGAQISRSDQFDHVWPQLETASLKWAYVLDGGSGIPPSWSLDNAFCEKLPARHNQQARSNSLINSTLMDDVELSELKSIGSIDGARFEKNVKLRSLSGDIPELILSTVFVAGVLSVHRGELASGASVRTSKGVKQLELRGLTIKGDLRVTDGGAPIAISCHSEGKAHISGGIKAEGVAFSALNLTISPSAPSEFVKCRFPIQSSFRGSSFAGLTFRECEIEGAGTLDLSALGFGAYLLIDGGSLGNGDESKVDFTGSNAAHWMISGAKFQCQVIFRVEPSGKVEIRSGKKGSTVFFHLVDFRNPPNNPNKRPEFLLSGCEFFGSVDFRNVAFGDTTEFDNCSFTWPPMFFDAVLHSDTSFSGAKFDWQSNMTAGWRERTLAATTSYWFPSQISERLKGDELYLGRVERAFTELREHAEGIRARPLAAQFHKEELEARRRRVLDRGVPRSERWVNTGYKALSDYGDSFTKPFLWLMASWLAFGLVYFQLSGRYIDNIASAAAISLAATFKPWAALDSGIARAAAEWTGHCETLALAQRNGFGIIQSDYCLSVQLTHSLGLPFQALVMLQSIVSIILIFLLLLAVRRKFQLS